MATVVTATVTATVTVVVVAMSQGVLLTVSENDRYLVDGAGNPVLFIGDAAWSGIAELTTAEMDTYLETRAGQGFNIVLVNLIENYFSTNAPNNIYDDPPFTGADFTTPNEDYFTVADHFIEKARDEGVYILLSPTYLGLGDTEGWVLEIDAASNADMEDWGEYVGNRYKNYDNVIWVVGGDRSPDAVPDVSSKLESFVTGLQNVDTRHTVVTVHSGPGGRGGFGFGDPDWMTVDNTYIGYGSLISLTETTYANIPTKPFFHIEGEYEPNISAQLLRSFVYITVLGGGIGHIFGRHVVWSFDSGWEDSLDSPGANGMGCAGQLFNTLDWTSLVPDVENDLVTSGYSDLGAAINAAGTLAVIYMPSNRTMTVDMSLFAGTVTARWYDPTSGDYTADAASPLSNSGTHDFSRAAVNDDGDADWVLLLEA